MPSAPPCWTSRDHGARTPCPRLGEAAWRSPVVVLSGLALAATLRWIPEPVAFAIIGGGIPVAGIGWLDDRRGTGTRPTVEAVAELELITRTDLHGRRRLGTVRFPLRRSSRGLRDRGALPHVAWITLLGVFAFDATATILLRAWRREPWNQPHRNHAYHWRYRAAGATSQVAATILLTDACLALTVWQGMRYPGEGAATGHGCVTEVSFGDGGSC
jgi:UDP-N-acetylmuramyl pentapeptide phosphotransferase/UDP-N-acetylglucosamine-1-phosphate transferase